MSKGISAQEYQQRRFDLMSRVGEGSIILITSAPELLRNGDSTFPYRQNSDFYYLTGFAEPEAVIVLIPEKTGGKFILFNRPKDPAQETWTGKRLGQDDARAVLLVDKAYAIDEIEQRLPELIQGKQSVYFNMGYSAGFDQQVFHWVKTVETKIRTGIKAPTHFANIAEILHEMRLLKSPAEIQLLKKAADISAEAHHRAMRVCQPGLREYEIEAEILHEFYAQGSRYPAYTSIVARGENACILHYINNDDILTENDLLLIDAGAEYEYYASDITRTFPVNGKFSRAQRDIYQLVLSTQKAAIAAIKPGLLWNELQDISVKCITEGLLELGLLQGDLETLIATQACRKFYMHKLGHWLGMDVHDVGKYRENDSWRALQPNMVFTVEPGIYIPPHSEGVAEKWWGIGVRIEDDVLVTEQGCEVLSKNAPKEIAEIEAIMTS